MNKIILKSELELLNKQERLRQQLKELDFSCYDDFKKDFKIKWNKHRKV